MSIVVNLRYTGVNGNAAKFAQEMEQSGTADLIRAEDGNCTSDRCVEGSGSDRQASRITYDADNRLPARKV